MSSADYELFPQRPNKHSQRRSIRSPERPKTSRHAIQHRSNNLLRPLYRLRNPLQHLPQALQAPRLALSLHVPLRPHHRLPRSRPQLERPPRHALLPRSRGKLHVPRLLLSDRHVVQTLRSAKALLLLLRQYQPGGCIRRSPRQRHRENERHARVSRLALDLHPRGHSHLHRRHPLLLPHPQFPRRRLLAPRRRARVHQSPPAKGPRPLRR